MFTGRSYSRLGLAAAMLLPALSVAHGEDICANPPVSGGKIEDRIVKQAVWLGNGKYEKPLPKQPRKTTPLADKGKLDIKGIGIHNTGIPFVLREGWNGCQILTRIHEGHLKPKNGKKLGGFAYHYFIDTTGAVFEGRDIEFVAGTYTRYNASGLVTVVLQGAFSEAKIEKITKDKIDAYEKRGLIEPKSLKKSIDDKGSVSYDVDFKPNMPTAEQLTSLRELLVWLSAKYQIDPMSPIVGKGIHGHQDFPNSSGTSCPGKNLSDRLPELRQSTKDGLAARTAQ